MKQDTNKLMEEARVAVKHASDKIADAHAESFVYKHPAGALIGHLRDLCDALYGLTLHAYAEVRMQKESLSQVMERTQAKKCFVVPTRERMAQEDIALQAFQQQYCVPKGAKSAGTLSAPKPSDGRVPMTDSDRLVEMTLQRGQALHPDYEMIWDAPPGPPDWQPVVSAVYPLSNGNVAYLFGAGPDKRNLERVEKRTLKKKPAAEKQLLVVHKTCPSWGETQCGASLFTAAPPPHAVFKWKGVTCKECLKLRGVQMPRDKGIKQAVRAAKRNILVDNGDLNLKWGNPQPNHPNRFYLLVNGNMKRNPKGNGYYTIQQARRLQKKLKQERACTVQVAETYLHR